MTTSANVSLNQTGNNFLQRLQTKAKKCLKRRDTESEKTSRVVGSSLKRNLTQPSTTVTQASSCLPKKVKPEAKQEVQKEKAVVKMDWTGKAGLEGNGLFSLLLGEKGSLLHVSNGSQKMPALGSKHSYQLSFKEGWKENQQLFVQPSESSEVLPVPVSIVNANRIEFSGSSLFLDKEWVSKQNPKKEADLVPLHLLVGEEEKGSRHFSFQSDTFYLFDR